MTKIHFPGKTAVKLTIGNARLSFEGEGSLTDGGAVLINPYRLGGDFRRSYSNVVVEVDGSFARRDGAVVIGWLVPKKYFGRKLTGFELIADRMVVRR